MPAECCRAARELTANMGWGTQVLPSRPTADSSVRAKSMQGCFGSTLHPVPPPELNSGGIRSCLRSQMVRPAAAPSTPVPAPCAPSTAWRAAAAPLREARSAVPPRVQPTVVLRPRRRPRSPPTRDRESAARRLPGTSPSAARWPSPALCAAAAAGLRPSQRAARLPHPRFAVRARPSKRRRTDPASGPPSSASSSSLSSARVRGRTGHADAPSLPRLAAPRANTLAAAIFQIISNASTGIGA